MRVLRIVAAILSVALFATCVTGWLGLRHLKGNVTQIPVPPGTLETAQPQEDHPALNYLVIGSDNRQVPGGRKYGAHLGEDLADTVILVHLSGDGKSARMVSFPRDGLVTIPECKRSDGSIAPEHQDKFNAAYAIGGPVCTVKTVKAMSGLPINDFIVVSLPGFVKISNALGGVEVCLPQAVVDPDAKLDLPAGRQKVKGEDALAYVRERKVLGGSRIRRQQAFLASAIKEATSSHLLFTPWRLYRLLNATTNAITTGNLQFNDLRDLAERFKGIKPGHVSFYTVPTFPETRQVLPGYDNAAGVFVDPIDTASAQVLFDSIEHGDAVPVPTPTATPTQGPKLVVAPASVPVRVLNGNGIPGAAGDAADDLRGVGFSVVSIADADTDTYTQTVVRYGPSRKESSQTLAAAVPGAVRQYDPGLGDTVELVLGSNYTGAEAVTVEGATPTPAPTTTPRPIQSFTATEDPCTANTTESGPA